MQILHVLYHRKEKQNKPDTVVDKHKQNINLLFCNNYRGEEALAVSNSNNKG